MCTVVSHVASQGSRSPDRAVVHLAASLREAELVDTAERSRARLGAAKPGSSRSTFPTGRRFCACWRSVPRRCLELRATLPQEHVWRQREGLG